MRTSWLVGSLVLALTGVAAAQPPDVQSIVGRMKAALEPSQTSVRQVVLTISAHDEGNTSWTYVEARKKVGGQNRMLFALRSPADSRGIAGILMDGTQLKDQIAAVYIPMVRRVRQLSGVSKYEAFLSSDFTYSDLGFLDMRAKYTLQGTEKKNGQDAYKLDAIPPDQWYYSHVVTWVDPKTFLPIERNYFDPSGQLWKVETFDEVTDLQGHPTPLKITMTDKQSKDTSSMQISGVKFDVDLPDSLFDPMNLRAAPTNPALDVAQ